MRIMASYFILIAICLILINFLAVRELENHYVNLRKKDIYAYARELSEEASEEGVFGSSAFRERVNNIAYESFSKIYIISKSQFLSKNGYTQNKTERMKAESYAISLAIDGQEYIQKTKDIDENILLISVPVKVKDKIVGALYFTNSLADIYANINEIQRQLVVISLVTLLLFIIASYMVAGKITKPIENLIQATEAMASGKLNQRVEVKGRDELARLCYSFNNMNENISQLDKERRQFVADASHELKSPLASIKVLVESLLSGGVENKEIAYDFLGDIDNEVDRLSNIVGRLLELTRLESGYGMKINKFDIGRLVEEVVMKVKPIAISRNINIEFQQVSLYIEGNRDNMFRAIYNIVENAVKYSEDGETVDVWIEEGNEAKIYIKDKGPGIPKEEINKIFDRFYRVDKARTRRTGGSGLGLSIAREIIKKHNGKIDVNSRVGEGSLFIITIPYKLKIKEC